MSNPRPGATDDLHSRGAPSLTFEGRDPVIEEVRAIRAEYAESLGNDLAAIVLDLQRREAERPEAVVTLSPKRVSTH